MSGKVAYKDQTPLTTGRVAFHSTDEDEKFVFYAPIGSDGRYQLKYGTQWGAPSGIYRVAIEPNPPSDGTSPTPPGPEVHQQFTRPGTSRLQFTVKAGENTFDITVWK